MDNLTQSAAFGDSERDLMAQVARCLSPSLDVLAARWADAIKLDAPGDKLPQMRQTLGAMTRQILSGFFQRLSDRDPEGALTLYDRFVENLIRSQLGEPERQRATIEMLFDSARIVRFLLAEEIKRVLGNDEGTVDRALLCFSRLWSRAAESLSLIYTRLHEGHLRRLYDEAQLCADRLRESEERFRRLVEEAKDYAIWMLDPAGRIVSWNRGGEQLTGWQADEIIGRGVECFFLPEDLAAGKPHDGVSRARADGRSEEEGWRVRKDGSRFIAHVITTTMHDQNGGLLGFSTIWRDITMAKTHERELTEARDAALESSRLKSAFLANITHEIRTPLNIILGYGDMMAERLSKMSNGDEKQYIEPLHRAGKRLLGTINSMLEISRIEAGSHKLKPRNIDLDDFVGRLTRDLRVLAEKKGLTLSLAVDAPGGFVAFDEYCLSNALTNLLQNAIKFTEHGSVALRIYRDGADTPCLEVRDTGVGIDAAYLPHIFEAFSQENVGVTRSFQGVGLGLSLVRKYLELNGAEIAVASRKGEGSTFTIQFHKRAALASDAFPRDDRQSMSDNKSIR